MKKRVISAALLIIIMLGCVFLSPVSRLLFFALAGCLCAYEYSMQMEKLNMFCSLYVMILYLIAQAALTLLNAGLAAYCACFVGAVYLAMLSGILRRRVSGNGALDTVAGLTYPCMLFAVIMMISVSDIWLEALALGCLSAWSCDTGALLGGSRFGSFGSLGCSLLGALARKFLGLGCILLHFLVKSLLCSRLLALALLVAYSIELGITLRLPQVKATLSLCLVKSTLFNTALEVFHQEHALAAENVTHGVGRNGTDVEPIKSTIEI